MHEANYLLWAVVYGYTGWLWGKAIGWPISVTIAAVVLGLVVGGFVAYINPYFIGPVAVLLMLVLPWFFEGETWRWIALAICASPLPIIAAGLILKKSWT